MHLDDTVTRWYVHPEYCHRGLTQLFSRTKGREKRRADEEQSDVGCGIFGIEFAMWPDSTISA